MILAEDAGFRYGVRKKMVMDALERGIKPTARDYGATVKTVRKWVRRYKAEGVGGLEERSRAPRNIPHKKPKEVERRVVELKRQLKGYGVGRMVKEFDLPCGKGAALRIARENGLIKKRKKKRQRRNDLKEEKAKYRVGEVSCEDTKDLTDIPAYWT